MRFTFKYQVKPSERKLNKQNKQELQKYPFIPIKLYSKTKKTQVIEALLDSGCDGIYLWKSVAEYLNLQKGKKEKGSGVGGISAGYETKVGLIIGRGGREVDLGYVTAVYPEVQSNVPILLGRHPVFEKYQIIFEEYNEKVILIPIEIILGKKK